MWLRLVRARQFTQTWPRLVRARLIDNERFYMLKLCTVLCLAPTALFAALPIVDNVELQPLASQAKRIIEASDYLGSPLTKEDRAAIEKATNAQEIQRALDKYCLF